jgi:ubiquinone/menaquinone biosynthesis C-methylase UbiE
MSTHLSLELDSAVLAEQYDRLGTRQFHHGLGLLDALYVHAGDAVLDVGCGTGLLTEAAAQRTGPDGEVLGIDPLPLRVQRARQRAQGRFETRVGRAEELQDLPDAHYDVVYFNSVIHWVSDQPKALQWAFRVLKPGGRVGFTTMAEDVPHDLHLVLRALLEEEPSWRQASVGAPNKLTRERAATLLTAAGFEVTLNEIREFDDAFDSVDDVIAFSRASSFGNFLSSLPDSDIARLRERLGDALEVRRGPQGLQLTRRLIFATARKPLTQ